MNYVKQKSNRIYKVVLFYWIILVIWQNLRHTVTRSGIDLAIKVGLILWLLIEFLWVEHTFSKKPFIYFSTFLTFFLLVYVFIERSFKFSTILIYIYPLLLVFLTCVLGNSFTINIHELLYLCNGTVITVAYITIFGLIFHSDQFIKALTASTAYGNELRSFFVNSHEYGLYLAGGVVCCLIALKIKSRAKIRDKFYYWLALLLFFPSLLLTYSRTTLLGILCVFVVLVIFSKKNGIKRALIIGGIIIALLIIFIEPVRTFVFNNILKENKLGVREDIYQMSFEYFKEGSVTEILFGRGIEASRAFSVEETTHTSVHNAYLQILLYYGIIGLLFLAVFYIVQIIETIKLLKINRFCGAMMLAVEIMGIVVMFTNTAYVFFSSTDSYFLTLVSIIVPKYVRNAINDGVFYVESGKEVEPYWYDISAYQGGITE